MTEISGLTAIFAQLGAIGILVAILVWLVLRYEKRMGDISAEHAVERGEWRAQMGKQHEEILQVAKDSNIVLAEIRLLVNRNCE